jgi:hypothetical protein
MAFTLNNFCGFETGGLEELVSTGGSPVAVASPVRTGGYALNCDGSSDSGVIPDFVGGTSDQGDDLIVGFAVRFSDLTPSQARRFFSSMNQALTFTSWRLMILANGDLELRDESNTIIGSAVSAPFTIDTFHYIEVVWQNLNSGNIEVFIDGSSVLSSSGEDLLSDTSHSGYDMTGLDATGDIYFDDIYTASGAAGASDRLGPSEVIAYRSSLNSATPDDGGTDLDANEWLLAQTVPFAGSTDARYTGTGAGAVDTDDVGGSAGTGGPNTDTDITGDINGVKAINQMARSGGPGSDHFILLGNDTDGTTRSADLDPTTSLVNYFFVSEAASIVPTSSEYIQIGFETTGNQDFICRDMLGQILHTPTSGSQTDKSLSQSAVGTSDLTLQVELNRSFAATGTSVLSRVVSYLRTFAHSAVGTVTLAKQIELGIKAITATGTAALALTKVVLRTLAHAAIGTATLARQTSFLRSFAHSAVGTSVLAMMTQFLRSFAATATGTTTLLKRVLLTAKALTATGTATLSRTKVSIINAAMSAVGALALTKQVGLPRGFSATGTPTISKQVELAFAAVVLGTSTLLKSVLLDVMAITAVGTATLQRTRVAIVAAAMSAVGTLSLLKQVELTRGFSATGTPTLLKQIEMAFALAAIGTTTVVKSVLLDIKAFAATGTSVLTTSVVALVTASMTATGTTALAKQVGKLLSAAAIGTASVLKQVGLVRAFAAIGTVARQFEIGLRRSFTATGTASSSTVVAAAKAFALSAVGTLVAAEVFMGGGGGPVGTALHFIRMGLVSVNRWFGVF